MMEMDMENVNHQFLLSMLVIALGYVMKTFDIIKEQDGEGLARIIFNITLPALIITTFSTITIDFSLILITLISVLYGTGMALLGLFVFKKEVRSTRGMLSMMLPGFNIGLFAYPLVEAIWGQEGLKYFGMFDVGNSLVLFILCYLIASHFSSENAALDVKSAFGKLAKSIPLLAYVTTFLFAVSGLRFPQIVLDITPVLAKANMPLSLLLLGINLNFSFTLSYWKNIGRVLAFRYVIGLMAGGAFFFFMPFETLLKYTLLIGLILPIGMAVIPYSVEFNYDQRFVGTLTNITIFISFSLIWLIVGISP
jgi:predicted permease